MGRKLKSLTQHKLSQHTCNYLMQSSIVRDGNVDFIPEVLAFSDSEYKFYDKTIVLLFIIFYRYRNMKFYFQCILQQ